MFFTKKTLSLCVLSTLLANPCLAGNTGEPAFQLPMPVQAGFDRCEIRTMNADQIPANQYGFVITANQERMRVTGVMATSDNEVRRSRQHQRLQRDVLVVENQGIDNLDPDKRRMARNAAAAGQAVLVVAGFFSDGLAWSVVYAPEGLLFFLAGVGMHVGAGAINPTYHHERANTEQCLQSALQRLVRMRPDSTLTVLVNNRDDYRDTLEQIRDIQSHIRNRSR